MSPVFNDIPVAANPLATIEFQSFGLRPPCGGPGPRANRRRRDSGVHSARSKEEIVNNADKTASFREVTMFNSSSYASTGLACLLPPWFPFIFHVCQPLLLPSLGFFSQSTVSNRTAYCQLYIIYLQRFRHYYTLVNATPNALPCLTT